MDHPELWSIGNNTYGQQGNATNTDISKINAIKIFNKTVKDIITAEYGATYILFEDGTYECCGYNECGQLGTKTNININQWSSVNQISIGKIFTCVSSTHTFCISKTTKQLYAVGSNAYKQFGCETDSNQNNSWIQIKKLPTFIEHISTSWKHTVFLSENGEIYVAGCSYDGALGLGLNITISPVMSKIRIKTRFRDVACGLYHTLAIDEKHILWSWGANEYGQLGHGDFETVWQPKQLNYFVEDELVDGDIEIVKISCGHRHNMVLASMLKQKVLSDATVSSEKIYYLYLFGNNTFSQCGDPSFDNIPSPTFSATLENKKIIDVKCGANHNVVRTKENYYLWGDNEYNQCLSFEQKTETHISEPLRFNMDAFHKATRQSTEMDLECKYETKRKVIGVYPGYKETRIITVDCKQQEEEVLNETEPTKSITENKKIKFGAIANVFAKKKKRDNNNVLASHMG